MDHFAVARGGFGAGGGVPFKEERPGVWALGERFGDGEADGAGADYLGGVS